MFRSCAAAAADDLNTVIGKPVFAGQHVIVRGAGFLEGPVRWNQATGLSISEFWTRPVLRQDL